MDPRTRQVLETAVKALADFKREFGRDLLPSFLAELYVALEFDLQLAGQPNQSGFDLIGSDGKRYQVKQRAPDTQNVDVNSFDFDYLVLVNLSDDYHVLGMWKLHVGTARKIFVHRDKFRKYQTTQKAVKEAGERIK